MSFKRSRSLTPSKFAPPPPPPPQQNEFQQRTTRLSSRVSKFDSRVMIFEPGNGSSVSSADDIIEKAADDAEEPKLTPKRSRKRIKLESETETDDIADIEDLLYVQHRPTGRSSSRKDPKAKKEMEAGQEEKGTDSKSTSSKGKATASKSKSPSKKKNVPQTLERPHPAPPNWRETYDTIKSMRSRFIAPVDTMGCAQAQTGETDPRNRRYATLVSLMLSSQTKDEVTHAAIAKLRTALGGSISLEAMIAADDEVISNAISQVGFWRKKTDYLKQAAVRLRDEFNSDVPKTDQELMSLLGVGPKMTFLTLQIAWGLNLGIGVDVHVHRITNLLGWHKPPTKDPEQTRLNLESWLPEELYYEINQLLVGFGQVICPPVNPRCDICDLNSKGLCPSARKVMKTSKKKRKDIIWVNQNDVLGDGNAKVEIIIEEVEQNVFGLT